MVRRCLGLLTVFAACTTGSNMSDGMTDEGVVDDGMTDDATDDGAPLPTAAELLAATATCETTLGGPYAMDSGGSADISVCGARGVVFWTADMDIDCDGKRSEQCNEDTDGSYLPATSAVDSNGDPLDAATLPFVVVPLASGRFDAAEHGIEHGTVFAVVYGDQLAYGVFGDKGPSAILGEASYAMAALLGIDPDPSTGGTDGPVRYIAFPNSQVEPIEDHAMATATGQSLATALLAQ